MSSNLAEILEATPRRVVEFDLSKVDIGKLTLLELLDAADAADIPIDDFRSAFLNEALQGRLVYAIAWVIVRRIEPDLTYAEACGWDLLVTGEMQTDVPKTKQRAKALVAVAAIAGVTTREAEGMTIAEVSEATELVQRRNRAARRRK